MEITNIVVYVGAAITIILGLLQCYFGYKIFKIMLGVTGFIVGGILGAMAGMALSGNGFVALGAGILGGIIGAWLMVAMHFVGVFLFGAFLGAMIGYIPIALAGMDALLWPVLIILGLLGGILALWIRKPVIIIATAFSGAYNVIAAIYFVSLNVTSSVALNLDSASMISRPAGIYAIAALVGWLVIGTSGAVFQFKSQPESVEKPKPQNHLKNTGLG